MTEADVLDGILAREGGWRDAKPRENAPDDPPTNKGITLDTFKLYHAKYLGWPPEEVQGLGIPDLRALTDDLARQIYAVMFVVEPGFTPENIPFEPLRVQLIDFGVNSGPARAVRWLQRVLRLSPVTGVLDAKTIGTLRVLVDQGHDYLPAIINDALVAARSYMIDQAVDQGTMRKQDEEGVESRALSFFLAKP